jgi:3-deoxy-7-phosphoheptulonate synthase
LILVLRRDLTSEQLELVQDAVARLGLSGRLIPSSGTRLLVITEEVSTFPSHVFSRLPGVEKIFRVNGQCSLVLDKGDFSIKFRDGVTIGKSRPVVIAGPCSVEGEADIAHIARRVKESGATMLRGGAYKPRSSPYDFQGLGIDGLKYISEAGRSNGLPVVSEIMAASHIEKAHPYIDMFQIGTRNMYNYDLLKEVGRTRVPVLLKRGMSATLQEFLNAAEYIMLEGNLQVVLCERGIRTFETHTRNTLDLAAVAALKTMTGLPVIVDPSHGTGRKELVDPMSRAAIACGADGLIIEVHDQPDQAYSDGDQAITPDTLTKIVRDANQIYDLLNSGSPHFQPAAYSAALGAQV